MLKDYHIIAGTFVTNTEITGYYPASLACLQSMSNTDFVDEVIMCDGQSIDETVNLHKNIPKVKIVKGPVWPIDSWTWENLADLQNTALKYFNNHENKNVISLLFSSDTVWTDDFRQELKDRLLKMIETDVNYIQMPFCKTINKDYRTRVYDLLPSFHIVSALKFTPTVRWYEYGLHELTIQGSSDMIWESSRQFYNAPISYDLFMFTRAQLKKKLERYQMINTALKNNQDYLNPDTYIRKLWLPKVFALSPKNLTRADHPVEAHQLLDNLTPEMFGFNCLGNLKVE